MNDLGKREKILLGVLAFAVVFFAYYKLFLSPMINKGNEIKESIKKYNIEARKVRNAKKTIEKQRAELEGLKTEFNEALLSIPETERNPEIAYNLKKLSDSNSVVLLSLGFATGGNENSGNNGTDNNQKDGKTNNASAAKKLCVVPVTIGASGDYTMIMNFISSIEKDKRIAEIKTLAFSNDKQTGNIKANINMILYYSEKITEEAVDYDFNTGIYGKTNLFK